jgi:calcium-dependent protein kinase
MINSKIALKEHEIVSVFQDLDNDCNGYLSKEEIVDGFQIVGIDASTEIDTIMNNVDIDGSGFLDFSEIKIALTDWESEIIKNNVLVRLIQFHSGFALLKDLKECLPEVLPHEWNEFTMKTRVTEGKVSLESLQEYILSSLR